MVLLNKCCCCCQLRTGVMVLGWIGLVWALLDLAGAGAVYANLENILRSNPDAKPIQFIVGTYLPIYIAYLVVAVLTYIAMVWGASAGNRFLLMPWLIMGMFSLVCMAVGVLAGGTYICIHAEDGFFGALILAVGIPAWFLHLYFWLCVLSCFQELRDSPTRDQNVLIELPKQLENVITDYRPPEYSKLDNKMDM